MGVDMAQQKRGSTSLPAHKSHLLHYMFTLATNKRAKAQHEAAFDKNKTAQQQRKAQAAIRSRYGITPRDWKVLTGPYPTNAAAKQAIGAHLQDLYPGVEPEVICQMTGIATMKLGPGGS
jgi:hypothetical protein